MILKLLRAISRPFVLGHIYGEDGSLYMERFAIFATPWLQMRLHHIVREDRDRHLHDHPWNFWSVVLQGGYQEARPLAEVPMWVAQDDEEELCYFVARTKGSIASRGAFDRHKIVNVEPNTWTLFITGKYRNQWGFYTPAGKIPYREYLGLPPKNKQ